MRKRARAKADDGDAGAPAKQKEEDSRFAAAPDRALAPAAPPAPALEPAPSDEAAPAAPGSAPAGGLAREAERAPQRAVASVAKPAPPPTRGEDPVSRHARLRAAGRLETVTRRFDGCAGEAERVIELDPTGAVVKVTRRGVYRGRPFEAELFYREDGRLGAVRWSSGGRVHEVRAGPPGIVVGGAGIPAVAFQPEHAAEAGPDAPPRCGP